MATIYINATTAEVTSDMLQLRQSDVPTTITAKGLAGVETVDIKMSQDSGATSFDAYYDGNQVQLTATGNQTVITSPGTYILYKNTTAGNVTVAAHNDRLGL